MGIERLLTVRCTELDPRGVLGPPGLMRLLEHMRWESVADPVVPWRRLLGEGHRFVVRAQRLDLAEPPVGIGEGLVLRTWLGRVGRSSCDVRGVVLRGAGGAVLARSTVTAVYCGPDGRPAPLPPEGADWIEPGEGASEPAWPTEPPADAFRTELVVRRSDTDFLRHANHARWADWIEDARFACAQAQGYGPASAGPTGCATHLSIDYAREAVAGDRIEVRTWRRTEDGALAFVLERGAGVVARAVATVA